MDAYDPTTGPDTEAWLALSEADRMTLAIRAHKHLVDDALHTDGMNEVMHGSLHAIVETQVASGDPEITGKTLSRLLVAGLTRHASLHAIMRVLMTHIAALRAGTPFDHAAYAAELTALEPADVVAGGLRTLQNPEPLNRAQRRAQKKKR